MSDEDWQRLALQLGRYALQRSRRFYWRTGSGGELPYGEVTESLEPASNRAKVSCISTAR